MFKFHRNSFKSSYRSSYYNKRRRKSPPLWMLLASIVPIVILLEILARLILGATGAGSDRGEAAIQSAYGLEFIDRQGQSYPGIADRGDLMAQPSLYTGYELAKDRQTQLWQIDKQGFRNDKAIPLAKPKGEVRVFLLGNSTAFGQGSTGNAATIAPKLETRLQQRVAQQKKSPEKYRPDTLSFYRPTREKSLALPPKIRPGNYRVINAAVPGYTSGNSLAQLALKILPYKPDAIVVLGGYTDLMLPSGEVATTIPNRNRYLGDPNAHYWGALGQSWQNRLSNSALYRLLAQGMNEGEMPLTRQTLGILERENTLEGNLPTDDAELQRRVQRYAQNAQRLVQLSAAAGVPLVLALQPEVTARSPEAMAEGEKTLMKNLGEDYAREIKKGYAELAKVHDRLKKAYPNNVYIYNFQKFDKPAGEAVFVDPIHLTEAANVELSKRLYDGVTAIPKMQVTPANLQLKK